MTDDMPTLSFKKSYKRCPCCIETKSRRKPKADRSTRRAARPLELVHTDIAGP
eukprot:CAMPEP_0181340164 /NCGR_PEP_ID=MMETSP1101-20121128/29684_1 /TAXON_ID=46948 /ORGANISM="Rhodomonas abbreviata, Strain Caron Lab Isolate" /LENGTH=52 /DNA_ID=CAMNT_0023451263 /DNA_START=96 /DNA_END=250 /DNA_ORIENTATION=+